MISVVIPTLNEAENLPHSIAAVRKNSSPCQLIVVDGGSTDRTVTIAKELGADLFTSTPQRATQMNLGARHSSAGALLFLHADTILPPTAFRRIAAALAKDSRIGGGAFARRFDSSSLFLRCTCLLAEFRNRTIGWHLGDQAIFVRRELFHELGGFRPMDRFEDLDFSRRLGRSAKLATLRPPVATSARRFTNEGPVRRTVADFLLTLAYLRGSELPRSKASQVREGSAI